MNLSARQALPRSSNSPAGIRALRGSRLLIFFGVLLLHVMAVVWLIRSQPNLRLPNHLSGEPLVILLLPREAQREAAPDSPASVLAVPAPAAAAAAVAPRRKRPALIENPPNNAITLPPAAPALPETAPTIDWNLEAQLAAKNALADIDKENAYRNLAGLSPEQLKFVRDNHLVPMEPGIVWAHPRVEVDPKTLIPIIHINDHCVLVLLIPFCGIGHIKPNDHLFDSIRDKRNQ
jgi:hypothetical protein